MQSRRASPRIPYDEAVCLTRADGVGRIYGRGIDLGTGGMFVVCTDSLPVGVEARCDLLLPGGPRPVAGRVVRVSPAPGGFELAIAFIDLKPGVTAVIDEMVVAQCKQLLAVKADGLEPAAGDSAPASVASGKVSKITVDPSVDSSRGDGVPRLTLEGDSGDGPRESTLPYGVARTTPLVMTKPLPTSLPPPCGQPLPLVVVAPELEATSETPTPTVVLPPAGMPLVAPFSDVPAPPIPQPRPRRARSGDAASHDASMRPTRPRRVPAAAMRGTAVVARRDGPPAWNWQQPAVLVVAPAPVPVPPRRPSLLDTPLSARSLVLLAPIVVLVVALVVQLSR